MAEKNNNSNPKKFQFEEGKKRGFADIASFIFGPYLLHEKWFEQCH